MTAPILRPYQVAQLDAIASGLEAGSNRLLVKSPTGTGKTVTFAALLKHPPIVTWLEQFSVHDRKMLIIAHREELLDQAAAKIHAANPGLMVMVEQGDRHASAYADVIIASIQTLSARRFRRLQHLLARTRFRVVIVDEAHHAAARTYRTALVHLGFLPGYDGLGAAEKDIEAARFDDLADMKASLEGWDQVAPKDRLLVGMTATPNRSDAIGLGCVFQSIAYSYALKDAIADKWLVPIVPWSVETTTSLDEVRIARGDFNQRELADAVNNERRNQLAVAAWREHALHVPTLAFTVDVAHAHALAAAFQQAGVQARAVSGETPTEERRGLLRDFLEGRLEVLTNCMVLTEGTDLPRAGCILHAKPTKSATLYEQMCLDAQTEILTERGWATIDTDIAGVRVAAFDLGDGSSHWSQATRIERPRGLERMWGIASPHLNIKLTGGHRMVVKTRRQGWHIRAAEALPQEVKIPVCAGAPATLDAILTDDDLTFLGLLLTDGSLSQANGGISLFQSDRYPEVVALIERTLQGMGVKYTHSVHRRPSNYGPRQHPLNRWTISRGKPRGRDKHLSGWGYLSKWVSANAKSLTPAYELLSERQTRVLIQAMYAGDGTKPKPATWEPQSMQICANHQLADQVQSLCVRRGMRCNKARRTRSIAMLHISLDRRDWSIVRTAMDGRPTWNVFDSTPDERVWCVTVDTGAIITRRNGKVAVVGNTGRGLRLFPGKQQCIVIDLVDVARKHSLQAAPVLYGLPPSLLAKGQTLERLTEDLDELINSRRGFDPATTFDGRHFTLAQLQAAASTFDIWTIPELGAFGSRRSMNWIKVGPDVYRLRYPWADGTEVLQVSRDLLDKWEVVITLTPSVRGPKRQRTIATQVATEDAAGALAETFVLHERRSVMKLKDREAPWRQRAASRKQLELLQKLRVSVIPPACTMGDASDLIDLAMVRKAR